MKISAYCIAKDEEPVILKMLDSLKDVADEVIVYDTGSTDGTRAVAAQWFLDSGVKGEVIAGEWDNSFAAARNRAIAHCTGDWVLTIDCDEVLETGSGPKLREVLEAQGPEVTLLMPLMVMCRDDGAAYQQFLCERVHRNGLGIEFKGEMHNWIDTPVGHNRVACPEVRFIHNRVGKDDASRRERADQRIGMAESVFIPKIEADPTDKRSLFYLAGTYFDSGRFEDAVNWYEKYMEAQGKEWPEERYQAGILMAEALRKLGRRDDARKTLHSVTGANWRRAEALVALGELAIEEGDLDQAEWWFKSASLKSAPIDPMFVEPDAHSWQPHRGLFDVYRMKGDAEKAVQHADLAVESGAPMHGEAVKYRKAHMTYGNQKIAVLVDRGQMDFIQLVIDHWIAQGKEVRVPDQPPDVQDAYDWADIIWCEWAGPLAAAVTALPKKKRIIVRVLGYEVTNGLLPAVNWQNVDNVIFVQRNLEQQAYVQLPSIEQVAECHVVSCGADPNRFPIGPGGDGFQLAMLGYINARKGVPLALQILAALPPEYTLHIAGDWQDWELEQYTRNLIERLGVSDRVRVYGRVPDAAAFLADKDFILSTGVRETFHYGVAEGMLCGCAPVIHHWPGCLEFYPPEVCFTTVAEAVSQIGRGYPRETARRWVVDNLHLDKMLKRIDRILDRPVVQVTGAPTQPYANEYATEYELERLGCRLDNKDPQVVIAMGHQPKFPENLNGAKKVVWHCEHVAGTSPKAVSTRELAAPAVKEADLVLTDQANWLDAHKRMGAKEVGYVSFNGSKGPWRRIPGAVKQFDVGFYGAMTERRVRILEELGKEFDVHVLESFDHEEVTRFVNSCRVIVNVHAYEFPMASTRIPECMGCGACVVTEPMEFGFTPPKNTIVETEDLASGIKEMLEDPQKARAIGEAAHDWVWNRQTFTGQVEKVLEAVGL